MIAYLALARVSAKKVLGYRMSFVLSLSGVLFQFIATLAVWRVLLAESAIDGFTWDQMRWYLLVGFASGVLVGLFADFDMALRIRDGRIALDLVKPVRYQEARFAEVMGTLWIEVAIVAVAFAVMAATTGAPVGPAWREASLFLLSMAFLVVLKFLVLFLCGLACFWTENYMGVLWARLALVNLLSGSVVPLSVLPHWLGTIAAWSPFAGLTSTPGLIIAGQVTGSAALLPVALQSVWIVVLWCGAKLVWRVSVRRLTVNGG